MKRDGGSWAGARLRRAGAAASCAVLVATALAGVASLAACSSESSGSAARSPRTSAASTADRDAREATTPRRDGDAETGAATAPGPRAPIEIRPEPESVEDWSFNGKPGRLITTPHYRVFTTQPRENVTSRLPLFLESALEHYRVAITGEDAPLPYPSERLDTYILSSKGDWELLARQLLGSQAEPFLNIRRGGFAYNGRALLFDLGTFDTLAVTAHEGWHQYTQRTFRSGLPIWMEEGLATYMEGHRWSGRGGRATFMPWANVERFDQLRRSTARGQLLPLRDLLAARPQELISATSTGPGLTYYAQVWALTHFLMEGENGKYRESLQRLVRDAASGAMERTVSRKLNNPRAGRALGARVGPAVFIAYFNEDLTAVQDEFDRFVQSVVATGSRQRIVAGESPQSATEAGR